MIILRLLIPGKSFTVDELTNWLASSSIYSMPGMPRLKCYLVDRKILKRRKLCQNK